MSPAVGLAMAGLAGGGEVAVSDDGAGVAAALVARLQQGGYRAKVIHSEEELTEQTRIVIALNGLRAGNAETYNDICRDVFRLARAFAPRAAAGNCIFVSVQDCGGDFGLSGNERALLGSLAGLIKTAAQEWPKASLKTIDLARAGHDSDTSAGLIEAELFQGGPDIEVGLHKDGVRTTLRSQREPISKEAPTTAVLPDNTVVVCSGGARGVTAATMIALAQAQPTRFALLGRTPLQDEPEACRGVTGDAALKRALLAAARARGEMVKPAQLGRQVARVLAQREIRNTIKHIQQTGGDALYLAVDVTDTASLAAALSTVRERWGSIDVAVHGAGVGAVKLIAEKTDQQFERVWSTKVAGFSALLKATATDTLKALILFSSVAARSGNVGQCDYAMANEALNKLAALEARRRGPGCVVKSLNWGPWEAGMVTPSLKAYFEQHGVALIPLARGGEMLLEELSVPSITPGSGTPRIEIVLGGPPQHAAIADSGAAVDIDGDKQAVPLQALDVFIDRTTHPYLLDHCIDGVVVLPVVMALEWFSRAAVAFAPGTQLVAVEQLRVFRGVRLNGFAGAGHWLRITIKPSEKTIHVTNESRYDVLLIDALDPRVRHYGATVVLQTRAAAESAANNEQDASTRAAAPAASTVVPVTELTPLTRPVYGGSLFHGPAFQVIQGKVLTATAGASANMVGVRAMNWRDDGWHNDVALLDGGLQLALLWSEQCLGGRALPTTVGAYRRYVAGTIDGPVRCQLRGAAQDDMMAVSHIVFIDQQGRLIAELEGVETHKRA